MEAAQDERITKAIAHFQAARRLRDGVGRHPEARRGLRKCARFHTARAATLASEICRKTATPGQPDPSAALPLIGGTPGWRAPSR